MRGRTTVAETAPGRARDPRTAELAARLDAVRERITRAAAAAGRADLPRLVVVTKTHPAEDVLRLAALGVTDVGENPDQAESSVRPLPRRAARMARPARVRMRERKPCFLARRRLFGWKVRLLTVITPRRVGVPSIVDLRT